MDIRKSTKAYADRRDTNFIEKDSGARTLSANDQKKLGQDNVGDVLNRIADPQWVDPSKKVRAVGDAQLDKDAFMKLMLTQMKHQDPTNPMQAHEMAAQLASFTSVEQLQNLNSTLEQMKKAQAPLQQFEALNLIGKSVSGDSAQLSRVKGDKEHTLQYRLSKDAEKVSVKIRNAQGDIVRSFSLNNQKAGPNSIPWNGQDERGFDQAPGDYSLLIEATDHGEGRVGVETQFDGLITGVNFTNEGPLLIVGNRTVKFSDVKKIVDPSLKSDVQKINNFEKQDLNSTKNNSQNKEAPSASNLGQVAMSRDMISKVEKEVGKEVSL